MFTPLADDVPHAVALGLPPGGGVTSIGVATIGVACASLSGHLALNSSSVISWYPTGCSRHPRNFPAAVMVRPRADMFSLVESGMQPFAVRGISRR